MRSQGWSFIYADEIKNKLITAVKYNGLAFGGHNKNIYAVVLRRASADGNNKDSNLMFVDEEVIERRREANTVVKAHRLFVAYRTIR